MLPQPGANPVEIVIRHSYDTGQLENLANTVRLLTTILESVLTDLDQKYIVSDQTKRLAEGPNYV
jgi:hypothetical protein